MRAMIALGSALTLGGCLGPTPAQQAFLPELSAAAEAVVLKVGATEATARPLAADKVVWMSGQHKVQVDSVFEQGRATARTTIGVVVRFHRDESGGWVVDEAEADKVRLRELQAELGDAAVRSAGVRKQQAVIDAKAVAAVDAFVFDIRERGQLGQLPGVLDVTMRGCAGLLTVGGAWTAQSKGARRAQVDQVGGVLQRVVQKHGVKCSGMRVEVRTQAGVVASWDRQKGSRLN